MGKGKVFFLSGAWSELVLEGPRMTEDDCGHLEISGITGPPSL